MSKCPEVRVRILQEYPYASLLNYLRVTKGKVSIQDYIIF